MPARMMENVTRRMDLVDTPGRTLLDQEIEIAGQPGCVARIHQH